MTTDVTVVTASHTAVAYVDGAPIPVEIGDAAGLQKLVAALRSAGYADNDLAKICRENWFRVLRSAWHEDAAS